MGSVFPFDVQIEWAIYPTRRANRMGYMIPIRRASRMGNIFPFDVQVAWATIFLECIPSFQTPPYDKEIALGPQQRATSHGTCRMGCRMGRRMGAPAPPDPRDWLASGAPALSDEEHRFGKWDPGIWQVGLL